MKLPHLDNVRVDREKIVDYLLNPEHSEGGHKAVFLPASVFDSQIGRFSPPPCFVTLPTTT